MGRTEHLMKKTVPILGGFMLGASLTVKGADTITLKPIPLAAKENYYGRTVGPHVLADPDYRIWGVNVIRWTDGKYHAFYARWKEHYGFHGWIRFSEIAHAVSDHPEGPFFTTGTVIENRHADGWDMVNAHNPAVCVAEGKILLYYIANDFREELENEGEARPPSEQFLNKHWSKVRNKQRIGVAMADRPEGPFARHPLPVVEPDGRLFKNMAVNPAVHFRNGRYTMIMKGDSVDREDWYRIQLVGHSDKPEGPFTFQKTPIYTETQSEDACIWYNERTRQYNSIIHVFGSTLARLVSDDGIQWEKADPFHFTQKQFRMADGTIWKPARVERPYVLTDDKGKPMMLYLAVWDEEHNLNANIAVPL